LVGEEDVVRLNVPVSDIPLVEGKEAWQGGREGWREGGREEGKGGG